MKNIISFTDERELFKENLRVCTVDNLSLTSASWLVKENFPV